MLKHNSSIVNRLTTAFYTYSFSVERNGVINARDKGEKGATGCLFSLKLGLRGKAEVVDLKKGLDNICCARNNFIPDACPQQLRADRKSH